MIEQQNSVLKNVARGDQARRKSTRK